MEKCQVALYWNDVPLGIGCETPAVRYFRTLCEHGTEGWLCEYHVLHEGRLCSSCPEADITEEK